MKIFFLILSLVLMPAFSAQAQSEELKTAKENLKASYEKLLEVQSDEARSAALKEVVDFTTTETETLILKLNYLKGLVDELAELQSGYLKSLGEFLEYQQNFSENLDALNESGELDLEDINKFASDFKVWRETIYDPTIKRIVSFLLVFRSSDFLIIANSRFIKIGSDLKILQNSKIVRTGVLVSMLEQAGFFLKEAATLNQEAFNSLLATSTDPSETNALVEKVIELIKSAYGKFLEMSLLFKKMLSGGI